MPKHLTRTETEILDYLQNGATPEEIQRVLKMKPGTYRVHLHGIRKKGIDIPNHRTGSEPVKPPSDAQWAVLHALYVQRLPVDRVSSDSGISRHTVYHHASQGRRALGLPRGASRREILTAMGYGPAPRENPMSDPMF